MSISRNEISWSQDMLLAARALTPYNHSLLTMLVNPLFALLSCPKQLPDVLDSVEDAEMRAQQQQQQHRLLGGTGGPGDGPYGRGGGGRGGDGREGGLPRETATDSEVGGGMSRSLGGGGTRPGSAPSARFELCVVFFQRGGASVFV